MSETGILGKESKAYVFGFEVSMHNILLVQVLNPVLRSQRRAFRECSRTCREERLAYGQSVNDFFRLFFRESNLRESVSAPPKPSRNRFVPIVRTLDQVFEEFSTRRELKHQVIPLFTLEPFLQLDNMFMLEFEQSVLSKDLLFVISDLCLRNDLNRDLFGESEEGKLPERMVRVTKETSSVEVSSRISIK